MADVCRVIGISRSTGWRWMKSGQWMKKPPIEIGSLRGWTEADVNEWLESKRAQPPEPPTTPGTTEKTTSKVREAGNHRATTDAKRAFGGFS